MTGKEEGPQIQVDAERSGTRDILSSSNVYVSDRINHPVQVPSIYMDQRGEIHNLMVGNKRINLLYTKKGVMRSGDIHKDTQHDFVFAGKVKVWTLENRKGDVEAKADFTVKRIYEANEYISIPPYTPHIFEFLEDTVIAEYWDGPFYAWLYEPYRSIVQDSFRTSAPGRFSLYEIEDAESRNGISIWSNFAEHKGWWSGILVGFSVGFVLSRRK